MNFIKSAFLREETLQGDVSEGYPVGQNKLDIASYYKKGAGEGRELTQLNIFLKLL